MKKKRILFTINTIYGGGAERILQSILARIDRSSFEPLVFLLYKTGKEKELIPPDVKYFTGGKKSLLSPLINFLTILYIAVTLKPDLIVSFLWAANVLSAAVGIVTRQKVFIVECTLPKHCMREFDFKNLRKLILKITFRSVSHIIAVSESTKENTREYLGIPEKRITVIENGVDIKAINELSLKKMNLQFDNYLVAIGRLVKVKNFSYLIELMNELKIKAKIDMPLVIAGEGPLRKSLEEKARSIGVKLYLPGFLENPYPLLKNAEIFLVSSNYEGLPLAVIEAMVLRKPVVALNCPGGISSMITDGETGLLVQKDDKSGFVNAISRLLSDKDFAKRITENAYKAAVEKFDIDKMMEKYEELFNQ